MLVCLYVCRVHYKEYLVSLINKNTIDPITIMTGNDLVQVLKRVDIPVPEKESDETDQHYIDRLVQVNTCLLTNRLIGILRQILKCFLN